MPESIGGSRISLRIRVWSNWRTSSLEITDHANHLIMKLHVIIIRSCPCLQTGPILPTDSQPALEDLGKPTI